MSVPTIGEKYFWWIYTSPLLVPIVILLLVFSMRKMKEVKE
jgi:hypothetical protein